MAGHGRVPQYLREIACVAFMLWDRERLRGWSQSGDHAAFEQQAVQSFGDAPAGEDREAYIQELKKAVQTQKNFFEAMFRRQAQLPVAAESKKKPVTHTQGEAQQVLMHCSFVAACRLPVAKKHSAWG